MKFFVDNNLGPNLARGMAGFGESVSHLKDHLDEGVTDEVMLKFVGENSWTLITKDLNIRRRPGELTALCDYKVGAFFLGGKNKVGWEVIQQLVRNWPEIKKVAAKNRRPFAFLIPPNGRKFQKLMLK